MLNNKKSETPNSLFNAPSLIKFLLLLIFIACEKEIIPDNKGEFGLIVDQKIISPDFSERIYSVEYEIKNRIAIPDTIQDIYQLKAFGNLVYFNDRKAVYSANLDNGKVDLILNPSKGRGPNEINQVFRFDTDGKGNFALSGFPENRIMIFDQNNGETSIFETFFNTSVLIFDDVLVGFSPTHISDNFFTNYSLSGDSLTSYGNYFNNQYRSQGIFDMYWDYNLKHNKIAIGYTKVGYIKVLNRDGNLEKIISSLQFPKQIPKLITQGGYTFMEQAPTVISHLSTYGDEMHLSSAKLKRQDGNTSSIVDVINLITGKYSHSYKIEEEITWPIEVLNDSTVITVNNNFDLVVWVKK